MSLEETLTVLNAMQTDGVLGAYAIGGAVAAFLYIEPGTTFDLDVFIAWEPGASGLLDVAPLYAYLTARGCLPGGETVTVAGWDVQFLPPTSPLVEEALQQARPVEIGGVPSRIFTQEHLMAICLETARPKDFARLVQFVEEGRADQGKLHEIFERHALQEKWNRFQVRFLSPP